MSNKAISELAKELKPYVVEWISGGAAARGGSGGLTAHDLDGAHHRGTLGRGQAPWVASDIGAAIANHGAATDPHPVYVKKAGDTMSGALLLTDGTVTAPGLALASSPTTGLYRQAADSLSVATAGVERVRIDASGRFAVGGSPNGNYLSTIRGATAAGGLSFEGDYTGNVLNFNATARHAAASVAQIIRAVATEEPQGAITTFYGLNNNLILDNSSQTLTTLRINAAMLSKNAGWTGAITSLINYFAGPTTGSSGSTGTHYGYYCGDLTDGAANFAFYAAGTTQSYFGGKILANSDIEVSGELLAANGTVGAPSIAGLIDTNTGLYWPTADVLGLVAGGNAIVNVGATGAAVNTTFDTTAALKVVSAANDDITLFLKQKSGQTARMWRVEDSAGQEIIVLDSQGNLQSGNPGFVSGLTGWQMTPSGNLEANNAFIRGELHASIFVMDEFHASGGTLYVAPAGKLELDATVYTTTGIEAVFDIRTTSASGSGSQLDIRTTSASGSGSQLTRRSIENYFEITDPPSGHAMILSPGDRVRCKALGLSVGIDLWDVWGIVTRVEDMTGYYRYYYERKSGGTNGLVLPAGTAIISYGPPGAGRIYLTADQNYAPYMQVFLSGEEPWNGQITPTVRIGRLDGVGLPGVSGIEQHGIVLSSNLSNASAPYLVASNLQMFQYKIDSEWNNGNPTARITADGALKLGTDIDNANTTGFDFNPLTGALTIGSAAYPGVVTVYGSITVTGGSGYSNFIDKPTALSGINTAEGSKLAGIAPGATVGATWGTNLNSVPTRFGDTPSAAGLYLTPTHLGYYNGSTWKAWIANTGEFYFGGSSGAHLEWDGSKLRGIGADGVTEQWYAQGSDGKFYAAGGSVWLDTSAINIAVVSTGTPGQVRFDRSGATVGSFGFLRSTGPVPTSNDGMIFNNAESTKFRFLGASQTEFAQNVSVTGWIQTTGDAYIGGNIEADNVLNIRTTAP